MAQIARPDSDVTVNTWAATPLWQKLDEESASDADFIAGDNNTNDACEVGLANLSTPGADTGHVLRYRYSKSASGGNARSLRASLYQGANLIAEQLHSGITEVWTAGSLTLSDAQAGNISDYNDLRLRFGAEGSTGGAPSGRRSVRVSWAELETPDAAPPHADGSFSASAATAIMASASKATSGNFQAGITGLFDSLAEGERLAVLQAEAVSGLTAVGMKQAGSGLVAAVVTNAAFTGSAGDAGRSAIGKSLLGVS